MYAILCPIKATMACTVKRSTMSVCRPPARTTPPAGISSTPTSVSVHHSLKVRMRCRCVCVYVFQTKVHIYKSASRPHVTVAVFVCVCRQTLWSLQGSVSEDALPEWRSLRELRTQRFLRLPTWIPGWALASRSAWITDQLSISGDSIISDECQDMVNNCVQQSRVKQKPHSGPIKNKMGGRVAALGCFSCCSWTQPYLSTQGRSVRSTSTSARATLATTEAPASTSRMASPVTVHLGGWGPAVRSVSQPVRCRLFSYSSKTWHMESFMPLCVCVCVCVCVSDLQWKPAHTEDTLTNMPRHSLYIIIGALCVAFVLMLIILIVGICRISRIEYQGSSRHAYQEFYNCRSIDSEFSNAIASIRHARSVTWCECMDWALW